MHDAIMVVKRSLKSQAIVAGGGAVEMEVAKVLREESLKIEGKGQLVMQSFARALEIVPRQLADNAGYDATDVLNALRKKHFHEQDGKWFGVDIKEGGICDTYEAGVWEPSINKINSLAAAGEAACVILSIDETVRNPKSEQPGAQPQAQQGRQGGGGMSGMMGNAMDIANNGARRGKLGHGVNYMKGRGGG
jgi:T-complex protein 1 subunit eta